MRRLRAGQAGWHQRPVAAVLTNGLSSAGNFGLTIGVARTSDLEEVGHYGLAFAIYVLATGLARSAVAEGNLADISSQSVEHSATRKVCAISATVGTVAIALGLALGTVYPIILGAGAYGLVLFDYAKITDLGMGNFRSALIRETLWSLVISVGLILTIAGVLSPELFFLVWASGGGTIGLVLALRRRLDLRPSWRALVTDRLARLYALDYLAGSGSTQLSMAGLGISSATEVLGAIRSGATLLSPANLVGGTARSLIIRPLARRVGVPTQFSYAVRSGVVVSSVVFPLAFIPLLLPASVGHALLGENWRAAKAVLLPLAFEAVLAATTAIAFAAHRAYKAGTRTLRIRLMMAPIRIAVILYFGTHFSAQHVAWSMVGVSVVGAFIWWMSFFLLATDGRRKPC